MAPRRNFGDDATVPRMKLGLRGDHIRAHMAVVGYEGGRRLVARRLEPENHRLPLDPDSLPDRVLPHDQSVLAVVGVVAAPDARRLEAEALVERDGAPVRDAHLERVPAPRIALGEAEELDE